jgi:CHAT domain
MRQIPATQMGPALEATMRGVGDEVADALPDAFWPIFAETWRRAREGGEEPRIQITTTEPWIPWELAWIDKNRVADAEELSPNEFRDGGALGALWQTARWTTPTRRLVSGDIPAAPPASAIEADEMAVIYGNYQGIPGIAELPFAQEEGNTIAMAHRALPLSVKDSDVTSLLACALQRDGAPFEPTVIHFAGHGETDVNNPEFTGLVLGGTKLNPFMVRGFQLVAKRQPFVFLNACEAGVAGETLAQLGGLVGAFLAEGARGFVAPLWKVDDVEARDIAVEFYRRTLIDGETVSEAMRQIRRQFSKDSGSATALAYVFYGNPNLRLERGAA